MTTTTSPALNPKQVHYLKRELITLELEKELNLLGENATLRTLFPTDNPADGITAGLATVPTSMMALRADTPLLRHAFNQYVLTFPLLQDTDRVEFWGKVQRFLDEFRKLQITNSAERTELTRRKKIGQKIERLLVLLYGVGIKVKEGKEESIRVEEELQKVKNKELVAKIVKIEGEESIVKWMTMNGLDINVVTVRDVTEKKHMMEVAHAIALVELIFFCIHDVVTLPFHRFLGIRHRDTHRRKRGRLRRTASRPVSQPVQRCTLPLPSPVPNSATLSDHLALSYSCPSLSSSTFTRRSKSHRFPQRRRTSSTVARRSITCTASVIGSRCVRSCIEWWRTRGWRAARFSYSF
ncbi:PX-associated-domain-containing protein [Jimgerdemannia flammicorona]|uniref:PX-associated-domain-containing protein n=1 Tax=Jimgerdemannia flammicorona TaxID=994334 RepID=A0A433QU14_9FUNG|nr:PX-associated-domain-containing protein [Jimgerdemannia flammicorona]